MTAITVELTKTYRASRLLDAVHRSYVISLESPEQLSSRQLRIIDWMATALCNHARTGQLNRVLACEVPHAITPKFDELTAAGLAVFTGRQTGNIPCENGTPLVCPITFVLVIGCENPLITFSAEGGETFEAVIVSDAQVPLQASTRGGQRKGSSPMPRAQVALKPADDDRDGCDHTQPLTWRLESQDFRHRMEGAHFVQAIVTRARLDSASQSVGVRRHRSLPTRRDDRSVGAPEDAEQPTADESRRASEYSIKLEGERRRRGKYDRTLVALWRISFRGHEVLMPQWIGTDLLVHLMRNQGKEFDARSLMQAVRKSLPPGDAGGAESVRQILHGPDGHGVDVKDVRGRVGDVNERDVIWDKYDISNCLKKLKRLEAEIEEHERAGDHSSSSYLDLSGDLERCRDLLEANAMQRKGKWVPKEYQKGTFKEMADLIRKHVRKVLYDFLRTNCRPLFDHLNDRQILNYGVTNRYQPKPRIEWAVHGPGGGNV